MSVYTYAHLKVSWNFFVPSFLGRRWKKEIKSELKSESSIFKGGRFQVCFMNMYHVNYNARTENRAKWILIGTPNEFHYQFSVMFSKYLELSK